MINAKDLVLALRGKAIEITTANSFTLAFEGREFVPEADQPYVQENVLFGDDNKIGYEDSSSDFQIGLYQLDVLSPRNISNLAALDIMATLRVGFARGTEMIVNNQMVRTMESTVTTLKYNPTHIIYAVRIKYSVIH